MKFKIERTHYGNYYILYKKRWWHLWRYVRRHGEHNLIYYWDTENGAKAYINNELNKLKGL
jgi:hypothetical protein